MLTKCPSLLMRGCSLLTASRMLMSPSGRGNLFSFLDMPLGATCDVSALQKRYHEKQSAVHPDKQHAAPPDADATQQLATQHDAPQQQQQEATLQFEGDSSYANAAYETLKDPFRRCRYLLKYSVAQQRRSTKALSRDDEENVLYLEDSRENLGDGVVALHGGSADTAACHALDEAFMMQMMEMNEIVHSFDANEATDEEKQQLADIEADISQQDRECYQAAIDAWEKRDLATFRAVVLRWTYVNNLKQHIHQAK